MLVLQGYNHLLVFDYNLSFQRMKKIHGKCFKFFTQLNLIGELDLELDLEPDPWSI